MSVRGTGAVNGNRVSSYQFEGFDFVGTPSTGLRSKPEIITGKSKGSYNESMEQPRVVDYIFENMINRKLRNSEREVMAEQMSFKDFEVVMEDSIKMINGSRNLSELHSRIAMVESKIPTWNIDVKTATFGQASINNVFREWDDAKSSVVNSFATELEPSSTNGNADQNKNSMQMKDATKEADDKIDGAEAIKESKRKAVQLAQNLRTTQVQLIKENKRYDGVKALNAKQAKSLTEAKVLLSEAATNAKRSQSQLSVSNKKITHLQNENNKLREALMSARKDNLKAKVLSESKSKTSAPNQSARIRRLVKENQELQKVADELNAQVGNEASIELQASEICAALEMALEEAVEKCILAERALKESKRKNSKK